MLLTYEIAPLFANLLNCWFISFVNLFPIEMGRLGGMYGIFTNIKYLWDILILESVWLDGNLQCRRTQKFKCFKEKT